MEKDGTPAYLAGSINFISEITATINHKWPKYRLRWESFTSSLQVLWTWYHHCPSKPFTFVWKFPFSSPASKFLHKLGQSGWNSIKHLHWNNNWWQTPRIWVLFRALISLQALTICYHKIQQLHALGIPFFISKTIDPNVCHGGMFYEDNSASCWFPLPFPNNSTLCLLQIPIYLWLLWFQ